MSAIYWPLQTALWRRAPLCRIWLPAILLVLALLLTGCAGDPARPLQGHDAADADAPVPPTGYRSTLRDYESRRPVAPMPWRERNDQVAPKPKGGQ